MTKPIPRIYTYKITFEEVPYYYYGVHKEKRFNEYYMGSPVTHKWAWDFYTPKKQILELFEYNDKGWIKAQEIEKRLIKSFYNTDKWCLNASCGFRSSVEVSSKNGKSSGQQHKENKTGLCGLTLEQRIAAGKVGGKIGGNSNKQNKTGFCGRSKEKMSVDGKKGARKQKENKTGIFSLSKEQLQKNGKKSYELGVGIHAQTKEELIENCKKGAQRAKNLGVGIHGLSKEQLSENGKKSYELRLGAHGLSKEQRRETAKLTNSQIWECTITGHKSNPGALTHYQKARGIDTSNRIRIS